MPLAPWALVDGRACYKSKDDWLKRYSVLSVQASFGDLSTDGTITTLTASPKLNFQMIKSNHNQSREIEAIVNELLKTRNQLKDASAIRKLRLDDSLESQQFFIQCHELVSRPKKLKVEVQSTCGWIFWKENISKDFKCCVLSVWKEIPLVQEFG